MNDNKTEYVYCMSNKSFNRDLVKIGWTKNEPKKRAQQLYTTGVPNSFHNRVYYKNTRWKKFRHVYTHIFSHLRRIILESFFNISVEELRTILTEKVKPYTQ